MFGFGSVLAVTFLLQPYRPVIVSGRSMEPTFASGQLVFARPMNRRPVAGDVVLIEKDGEILMKRVKLAAGDCYREIYLHPIRKWIPMPWERLGKLADEGKVVWRMVAVPEGQVFVVGDNVDESCDSRDFGFLPTSSIRGLIRGADPHRLATRPDGKSGARLAISRT